MAINKDDILNMVQARIKEKEEVIEEQMKQIQQLDGDRKELQDKVAELQLRVEELEGVVKEADELKEQLAQILGS